MNHMMEREFTDVEDPCPCCGEELDENGSCTNKDCDNSQV